MLSNWHLMRILRLLLGIIIIIQGAVEHEAAFVLMGILFSGMSVLNIGCCGPAGCSTSSPFVKGKQSENEEITYEEIED